MDLKRSTTAQGQPIKRTASGAISLRDLLGSTTTNPNVRKRKPKKKK
jgi:hypothetical protein